MNGTMDNVRMTNTFIYSNQDDAIQGSVDVLEQLFEVFNVKTSINRPVLANHADPTYSGSMVNNQIVG